MGDIVKIKDTLDEQLLARLKLLEDIIPEGMDDVEVNPFIQYIINCGEVRGSFVEFLYCSEFLELLTVSLLEISKVLFEKKADTEWYKIMLYIMEEKGDVDALCKQLLFCFENNIDCKEVRDIVEKSNSVSDMENEVNRYLKEKCKDINHTDEILNQTVPNGKGEISQEYYIKLCQQQEKFIAQLMLQIEDLKNNQKELSHSLEEAAFHTEFAGVNAEERYEELEKQIQQLEEQCETLQKLYKDSTADNSLLSKKFEDEKSILSAQIENLEKEAKSLKAELVSLEEQLQKSLDNCKILHNRYIEQKRSTLNYQLQAKRLERSVKDTSEIEEKYQELENKVKSLEEEKQLIQKTAEEREKRAEQLQLELGQYTETIHDLKDSIVKRDDEINRLLAQIELLETQAMNSSAKVNYGIRTDYTMSQVGMNTGELISEEIFLEEEVIEEKEFPDSQMITMESGQNHVKRKSNWFTNLIASHSQKLFLKNDRQDQESMIFVKMMDMKYSADKVQKVRKSLSENVPCFDLYKLICENPTMEELDAFFDKYSETNAAFA